MTALQPGDAIRCLHCARWHPVAARYAQDGVTAYTRQMLFWTCQGQAYFAGQIGTAARFQTRPRAT